MRHNVSSMVSRFGFWLTENFDLMLCDDVIARASYLISGHVFNNVPSEYENISLWLPSKKCSDYRMFILKKEFRRNLVFSSFFENSCHSLTVCLQIGRVGQKSSTLLHIHTHTHTLFILLCFS